MVGTEDVAPDADLPEYVAEKEPQVDFDIYINVTLFTFLRVELSPLRQKLLGPV